MPRRLLFLISIALAACMAASDTYDLWVVTDFSPGLQTARSPVTSAPGAGVIVHNYDLNASPSNLVKREGYRSLFTIPGADSFLHNGLITAKYSTGDRQFFCVVDTADLPYAVVYASGLNQYSVGQVDTIRIVYDSSTTVDSSGYSSCIEFALYVSAGAAYGSKIWCGDSTTTIDEVVDTLDAFLQSIGLDTIVTVSQSANGDTLIMAEATEQGLTFSVAKYSDCCSYGWTADTSRATGDVTATQLAGKIPSTGQLQWTQFRDRVYLVNGVARGAVLFDTIIIPFPTRTPGTAEAIPYDSTGSPTGRRRYALEYWQDATDTIGDSLIRHSHPGPFTNVVQLNSEIAALYSFPPTPLGPEHEQDSIGRVVIWGTPGDVGSIDEHDSMWPLDTISLDSTNYETYEWTDTFADASIRALSGGRPIMDDSLHPSWLDTVRSSDTTTGYAGRLHLHYTPGTPTILSWDSTKNDSLHDSTFKYGIWNYIDPNQENSFINWSAIAGYAWVVTFADTNIDLMSAPGSPLTIYQPLSTDSAFGLSFEYTLQCASCGSAEEIRFPYAKDHVEKVQLAMPRAADDNVRGYLWRAPIWNGPVSHDTVVWYEIIEGMDPIAHKQIHRTGSDFSIGAYRMVTSFTPGDTVWDSIGWDSLQNMDPLEPNYPLHTPKGIMVYQDGLWIHDGTYVARTELDTSVTFDLTKRVAVDRFRGDRIQAMWVEEGNIMVAMQEGLYRIVYDNGFWQPAELSGHYGVLSPYSIAQALEGTYLFSRQGVRLEGPNIYRERSTQGSIISGLLSNFDSLSSGARSRMFGIYYDNKYILAAPDADTSYVAHKIFTPQGGIQYSWATWDGIVPVGGGVFEITGGTIFDIMDSLWFIKSGSSTVYGYGGTTDDGSFIDAKWRGGVQYELDGYFRMCDEMGVIVNSSDSSTYGLTQIARDGDAILDYGTNWHRLDSARYHHSGVQAGAEMQGFIPEIGTYELQTQETGPTVIEQAYWLLRKAGRVGRL